MQEHRPQIILYFQLTHPNFVSPAFFKSLNRDHRKDPKRFHHPSNQRVRGRKKKNNNLSSHLSHQHFVKPCVEFSHCGRSGGRKLWAGR